MKKVDNLTVHTGPYILIKKVLVEFTAGFGCLDRIRSYPKESATDPTKITGSATLSEGRISGHADPVRISRYKRPNT